MTTLGGIFLLFDHLLFIFFDFGAFGEGENGIWVAFCMLMGDRGMHQNGSGESGFSSLPCEPLHADAAVVVTTKQPRGGEGGCIGFGGKGGSFY